MAELVDDDSGESIGRGRIPEARPLKMDTTLCIGGWQVQITKDLTFAHGAVLVKSPALVRQVVSEVDNDAVSSAVAHPYTSDALLDATKHKRAFTSPLVEENSTMRFSAACDACVRSHCPCEEDLPCEQCRAAGEEYCSFTDSTYTAILRRPVETDVAPAKGRTYVSGCNNCALFGHDCDGRIPCRACLTHHRAFCTQQNDEGAYLTVLCAAYKLVVGPRGGERVVPRRGYVGDANEAFPSPTPARPSADVLARLEKRFRNDAQESTASYLSPYRP
jgi:hypothetical protein